MPRKPPPARPRRRAPGPRLDPAEQRATLEKLLAESGARPVEDFDAFLEEVGGVWPEDENIDDFLVWLRRMRNGEPV